MKTLIFSIAAIGLIAFGGFAEAQEGEVIKVHAVHLALESRETTGNPATREVAWITHQANQEPMVLTLQKEPRGLNDNRLGETYSGKTKPLPVTVRGIPFEVEVRASVQVIGSRLQPYVLSAWVRRNPQGLGSNQPFNLVTSVSAKSAAALQELVSFSGWEQRSFWLDATKTVLGQVQVRVEVNGRPPFDPSAPFELE